MNEKEYIWYKLCVFYHAKTEIFDRGLTDLRSPYDPTEAYIVEDRIRSYSNKYALNMRQFIIYTADKLKISKDIKANFNAAQFHFSAQGWIDEYNRLKSIGEMDFINEF